MHMKAYDFSNSVFNIMWCVNFILEYCQMWRMNKLQLPRNRQRKTHSKTRNEEKEKPFIA